jgi:AhpC/TSA family protein
VIARLAALVTLSLAAVSPVLVPDLTGRLVDPLQAQAGTKATVLLFISTDCPISNRYAPDIRKLHDAFAKDGVVFWLIYPNPADAASDIRDHLTSFSYPGTALRDVKHDLAKRAGATITPEAAVYDASGRLAYRGRVDDRYSAVGVERATATKQDLRDAIAATIAGKPVTTRFTQAVGCYIADFAR